MNKIARGNKNDNEHKVRTYKEYHSGCSSSELGLPPTPHPQASVPPPPCFWGEGNTRWRERGWESPNSDEGHTLWYSLYVRTLWQRAMARHGTNKARNRRDRDQMCQGASVTVIKCTARGSLGTGGSEVLLCLHPFHHETAGSPGA
jgi:hypothetical protein